VNPAKTAELIEIKRHLDRFGLRMGVQIPMGRGNFGKKAAYHRECRTLCCEPCETAETIEMPFGM